MCSSDLTVVLSVDEAFHADALLDLAQREAVGQLVLVGDAYAVPLADALDREPDRWQLDHLVVVASGGAPLAPAAAQRLLDHLEGAVVVDGYGTSETGGQARRVMLPGITVGAGFVPGSDTTLIGADGRPVPPGDPRPGRIARTGRLPLGYRNDPDRTAATFPVIDGERWALTGSASAQVFNDVRQRRSHHGLVHGSQQESGEHAGENPAGVLFLGNSLGKVLAHGESEVPLWWMQVRLVNKVC